MSEQHKYGLHDQLPFSKAYRGYTVLEILNEDPQYIQWCVENVPDFLLDGTAEQELEDSLRKINYRGIDS